MRRTLCWFSSRLLQKRTSILPVGSPCVDALAHRLEVPFGQTCDPTHGHPPDRGPRVPVSDASRDTHQRVKQALIDESLESSDALIGAEDHDAYGVAEHISIGEDLSAAPEPPEQIRWRGTLAGPIQGKSTEIVYFQEGWLRLRIGSREGVESEQLVEVGFLDPTFVRRWHFHKLWLSLFTLGLGCLATTWFLSAMGIPGLSADVLALSIITATATVVLALTMLIRGARRRVIFVTRNGRVPTVVLTAMPGRHNTVNQVAKEIGNLLTEASPTSNPAGPEQLRAEMQGHYRLRDAGVISGELCDKGTRRILTQFG